MPKNSNKRGSAPLKQGQKPVAKLPSSAKPLPAKKVNNAKKSIEPSSQTKGQQGVQSSNSKKGIARASEAPKKAVKLQLSGFPPIAPRAHGYADVVPRGIEDSYAHLDKFKMSVNPYAQTLVDPWDVTGVRIPQGDIPSSTFQIRKRWLFSLCNTATTAYNGKLFCSLGISTGLDDAATVYSTKNVCSLMPMNTSQVITTTKTFSYIVGSVVEGSSHVDQSNFFASNASNCYLPNWGSSSEAVPTGFDQVRLVSAGITVTPMIQVGTSGGMMVLAYVPCNTFSGDETMSLTLDGMLAMPYSCLVPLNRVQGGTILYRPENITNLNYQPVSTGTTDLVVLQDNPDASPGGFWVYIDAGPDNGGAQIVVEFAANYEAIPRTNTLYALSAPLEDDLAVEHAFDVLANLPMAHEGDDKSKSSSTGGVMTSVPGPKSALTMTDGIAHTNRTEHVFVATMPASQQAIAIRVQGPAGMKVPFLKSLWGGIKKGVSSARPIIDRLITEFAPVAAKLLIGAL